MTFKGWLPAALEFFEGLEADNSKTYWLAHKDVYDRDVRVPMELLLEELKAEFGEGRIFRPYRDVRFSRDKSPYKTNIAATMGKGYIHLSTEGLVAGAGMYHMSPDQLDRYRGAVAREESGTGLQATVDSLREAGIEIYGSDALKQAPKGYPKDHARVELLRYKGIVGMRQWAPAKWLTTSEAKLRVTDALRAVAPLLNWLEHNVGDAEEQVE